MVQSLPLRLPAILVVEDEVLVRMDLVETMEREGFKTYQAGDADGAIRLMEAHPEIKVLFTDIDMPGSMDGIKLSHYVRNRWPPVRIFVSSGHSRPSAEEMPSDSLFISKAHQTRDLQKVFAAAHSAGAG